MGNKPGKAPSCSFAETITSAAELTIVGAMPLTSWNSIKIGPEHKVAVSPLEGLVGLIVP